MLKRPLLAALAVTVGLTSCATTSASDLAGEGDGKFSYSSDKLNAKQVAGTKLASTLPTPRSGKDLRVAVILKALTNQYWQGIANGAKAAGKKYGVDVTVQAPSSETSQTEQLSITQTLVGQRFDGYVVAPESTSNLTPALNQMKAQGAPIVNVDDARIAGTTFVGPDHTVNGRHAADELARVLPGGGKVAQVEGQAGSSAAILRIKGFKEGLKKHKNLKMVASAPGDWDPDKAFSAAQQIIQQHPDVKGIYANNDTMAVGVAKAVARSGKKIAVIGTDGVPEAISGVRKGTMRATISPLPYWEGYWAVESVVRLRQGQAVPPWVTAPAQLITSRNVDEFFNSKGLVRTDLFN